MKLSRNSKIELYAGDEDLKELKELLEKGHTQPEIDIALENAIAYSQIETAEYLLSLGGDLSNYGYQGTYYSVHNNELEGLKFAISHGVDVNINNGQLLNTSIITAYNQRDTTILKWLLENGADTSLISDRIMKSFNTSESNELIRLHNTTKE